MPEKNYFIHFNGENLGPVPFGLLKKLIQLGRIQGQDYAASEGGDQWQRICDMDEFSSLFPSAPRGAVPAHAAGKPAKHAEREAAPEPIKETKAPSPTKKEAPAKPESKVQAKAEPKPEPKAEAKPAPKPEPPKTQPIQGLVTIGKKTFKIAGVRQAALLLELAEGLEEGAEVQMQLSGTSFPKPFEMKAILMGVEAYKGAQVHVAEFVRPNPAHKRALAPFMDDGNE